MRHTRTPLLTSLLLTVALAQPVSACIGLYHWFDRVFGLDHLFSLRPFELTLPATLEELPGHVILGTEKIDDFQGCADGRIIQFRSGSHVTCDDYGYDFSGYGTEVVIVARPHASGTSNYVCKFDCKMIVTEYVDHDVYDVLCDDYMEDLYGTPLGENVVTPPVDTDENPTPVVTPVTTPDTSDRVDLGRWNWVYDLPGGAPQFTLDMIYEIAENCKIAESKGWPVGLFEIRPGEWALVDRSMCSDLGDLYP